MFQTLLSFPAVSHSLIAVFAILSMLAVLKMEGDGLLDRYRESKI